MVSINPSAYDAWYGTPFGALCHRLERDALFSLSEPRRCEKVLDAGCGTGVYIKELLDRGIVPVGLDEDAGMLDFAARNGGHSSKLVRASIDNLPFKSLAFDKVISVCTLEFVVHPEAAVSEIARVLKRGGILLLGFLNCNSEWARLRMEKAKSPSSVWHGATFFCLAEITGIAEECGLRPKGFRSAVHFQPESEGMATDVLEALEYEGRARSPLTAAFIAAAFFKP